MNKIIRGCWQLATGHSQNLGNVKPILDAYECGFTVFDCADIYLGVESLLGEAVKTLGKNKLRIHTKFVPDLDNLKYIDNRYIESIIDRSLQRLQVDALDLVQFHWWDWEIKNYLYVMEVLSNLKAKGKIKEIGLTNLSTKYLNEFSNEFEISSLQCQVSLFDKRAERGIAKLCKTKNIKIFAYGSLLGGFVSEKWLGKDEPNLEILSNRSLIKYKLLLDEACGWSEFQNRLQKLHELSKKYDCDIASIAINSLLQSAKVDAVIAGLSAQNYFVQNRNLAKLPNMELKDLDEVNSWSCNLQGDAYEAERDKNSSHAKVMKYNLNSTN